MRKAIGEWEILERKSLEDHRIFKVQTKIVRSPQTGAAMEVKAISQSDWAVALPLTPDGEVVMVRQYRHGVEQVCLELPGGLIDPGDASPEAAARRELEEETGYIAADYLLMGSCFPSPAVFGNRCFFVLATDVRLLGRPQPDQSEELEVVRLPLDEVPHLIENGRISNGMVQLAFYKYFFERMKDEG
jgi:8-oxo-dGTP pyrophosphatase MutT (NUDIX family)